MDEDKQIYPLTARILRPLRWEMNCIQVEIKGERSSFMKVAGIIAEYNPFHKGHQYHIEETRKKTGADYVVVVMSGDYVQRGEPAIADKYMRTRMALSGGADLIIEMPAIYATASAEYFATAGIGILDQLGCVDYLSFGSEWAEVEDFSAYATLFLEEPEEYKQILQEKLKSGKSFPEARAFAAGNLLFDSKPEKAIEFLKEPNHILGLEYIKALKRRNSLIRPVVIKRKGNHYHENKLTENYSSATAIRQEMYHFYRNFSRKNPYNTETCNSGKCGNTGKNTNNRVSNIYNNTYNKEKEAPQAFEKVLCGEYLSFIEGFLQNNFVTWEDLMPYLDYTFLLKNKVIGKYFGMNLDLARRFQNIYEPGLSFEDLIEGLHARQITDAALRRVLLHIVLHMKYYPFLEEAKDIPIPYARILGFSKTASPLLKKIRQNATLDIIQRPAEGKKLYSNSSAQAQIYSIDIRTADLYEQIAARKAGRKPISEYKRQQVIR